MYVVQITRMKYIFTNNLPHTHFISAPLRLMNLLESKLAITLIDR